jgi:hypothetical protein
MTGWQHDAILAHARERRGRAGRLPVQIRRAHRAEEVLAPHAALGERIDPDSPRSLTRSVMLDG